MDGWMGHRRLRNTTLRQSFVRSVLANDRDEICIEKRREQERAELNLSTILFHRKHRGAMWIEVCIHACMTVRPRLFFCLSKKRTRTRTQIIPHFMPYTSYIQHVLLVVSFRYWDCWFCDRKWARTKKERGGM